MEMTMDLNDFDTWVQENLRCLLSTNQLTEGTPAFGIAKQAARHGLGSLCWKQRFIYLGQVMPLLRHLEAHKTDPLAAGRCTSGVTSQSLQVARPEHKRHV
jgi:hypothetical protein